MSQPLTLVSYNVTFVSAHPQEEMREKRQVLLLQASKLNM